MGTLRAFSESIKRKLVAPDQEKEKKSRGEVGRRGGGEGREGGGGGEGRVDLLGTKTVIDRVSI